MRMALDIFPHDYVPTVFDNYSIRVKLKGKKQHYNVALWDMGGGEDYDRLRPLSYPETYLFLLIFDVSNPNSFENITAKWYPEISWYCPDTPCILIGTKTDRREDAEAIKKLQEKNRKMIEPHQGEKLARELPRCIGYIETSAINGYGARHLCHYIVAAELMASKNTQGKKNCCLQ
jgi:small GTP-binding protein